MSRSDGKFPHYTKLEINPDEFPKNYWNSCQVCPNCETRWPSSHLFNITPCCGERAEEDTHSAPDMRWPDAVSALLTARFEDFYDKYNEGATDADLELSEVDVNKLVESATTH